MIIAKFSIQICDASQMLSNLVMTYCLNGYQKYYKISRDFSMVKGNNQSLSIQKIINSNMNWAEAATLIFNPQNIQEK